MLERPKGKGSLDGYMITGNMARIRNEIRGANALVSDNLIPDAPRGGQGAPRQGRPAFRGTISRSSR